MVVLEKVNYVIKGQSGTLLQAAQKAILVNTTLNDKIVVAERFHTLHCLPVDQSTFE